MGKITYDKTIVEFFNKDSKDEEKVQQQICD